MFAVILNKPLPTGEGKIVSLLGIYNIGTG